MIATQAHHKSLNIWQMAYIKLWCFCNQLYTNSTAYHQTTETIKQELKCIEAAQQNPEHFAPLYLKYHEQIFIFINKRIENLEVTADITSKVFLKCLKNIAKYKHQGVPFSAWLYKIAINEVNQYFRIQSKAYRAVSLEEQHINLLMDEIDYDAVPIDHHVLISVLLEQLNEHEIQFIELRFFENKSFKEIGYLLNITEVNAKIKTYRILKKLKSLSANINYQD